MNRTHGSPQSGNRNPQSTVACARGDPVQDRQSCQDWLCARNSRGRGSPGGMSGSFRTKLGILVKLSLPCGMPDRATVCGRGLACVRSGGCILGRQVLRVRHPCPLCPACLRRELRTRRRCGDVPTGPGSPAWLRLQVSRWPGSALDEILDSLFPCRLFTRKEPGRVRPTICRPASLSSSAGVLPTAGRCAAAGSCPHHRHPCQPGHCRTASRTWSLPA